MKAIHVCAVGLALLLGSSVLPLTLLLPGSEAVQLMEYFVHISAAMLFLSVLCSIVILCMVRNERRRGAARTRTGGRDM